MGKEWRALCSAFYQRGFLPLLHKTLHQIVDLGEKAESQNSLSTSLCLQPLTPQLTLTQNSSLNDVLSPFSGTQSSSVVQAFVLLILTHRFCEHPDFLACWFPWPLVTLNNCCPSCSAWPWLRKIIRPSGSSSRASW